jgi:hypothetical protein
MEGAKTVAPFWLEHAFDAIATQQWKHGIF